MILECEDRTIDIQSVTGKLFHIIMYRFLLATFCRKYGYLIWRWKKEIYISIIYLTKWSILTNWWIIHNKLQVFRYIYLPQSVSTPVNVFHLSGDALWDINSNIVFTLWSLGVLLLLSPLTTSENIVNSGMKARPLN